MLLQILVLSLLFSHPLAVPFTCSQAGTEQISPNHYSFLYKATAYVDNLTISNSSTSPYSADSYNSNYNDFFTYGGLGWYNFTQQNIIDEFNTSLMNFSLSFHFINISFENWFVNYNPNYFQFSHLNLILYDKNFIVPYNSTTTFFPFQIPAFDLNYPVVFNFTFRSIIHPFDVVNLAISFFYFSLPFFLCIIVLSLLAVSFLYFNYRKFLHSLKSNSKHPSFLFFSRHFFFTILS